MDPLLITTVPFVPCITLIIVNGSFSGSVSLSRTGMVTALSSRVDVASATASGGKFTVAVNEVSAYKALAKNVPVEIKGGLVSYVISISSPAISISALASHTRNRMVSPGENPSTSVVKNESPNIVKGVVSPVQTTAPAHIPPGVKTAISSPASSGSPLILGFADARIDMIAD